MFDLVIYLIGTAVLYTLPIIVVILLLRRRLHVGVASALLGVGFATVTAVNFYRFDWFDVWRFGTPSLRFMITSYGPGLTVMGGIGGGIGAAIVRHARQQRNGFGEPVRNFVCGV
jgi:hypothetical protein